MIFLRVKGEHKKFTLKPVEQSPEAILLVLALVACVNILVPTLAFAKCKLLRTSALCKCIAVLKLQRPHPLPSQANPFFSASVVFFIYLPLLLVHRLSLLAL